MKLFILALLINLFASCGKEGMDSIIIPDNDTISKDDSVTNNDNFFSNYFVSPEGKDGNPGTFEKPWATWQKAFTTAKAGDTVFIRGGVYYPDADLEAAVFVYKRNGKKTKPICIFNYPGERPVLNCNTITQQNDAAGILLQECKYFHIKGLTVRNVQQRSSEASISGFYCKNTNGIVMENCISANNGGIGFYCKSSDTTYYIDCDSYDNYDPLSTDYHGGQADGYVTWCPSRESLTIFRNCRAWHNSDDGFDCWQNEGVVLFENCISFINGRDQGDGNGFKLGRTDKAPMSKPQRVLTNCLAFNNRYIGFNQNDGNIIMTLYNNCSYNNGNLGFELSQYNNLILLRNNISYKNALPDDFAHSVSHDHNSWDSNPAIKVSDADFVSMDTTGMTIQRTSDGKLPACDFLKLAAGSDLINSGIDVGLPYQGKAPDLGPFEKE
jgi:hypothetical protein